MPNLPPKDVLARLFLDTEVWSEWYTKTTHQMQMTTKPVFYVRTQRIFEAQARRLGSLPAAVRPSSQEILRLQQTYERSREAGIVQGKEIEKQCAAAWIEYGKLRSAIGGVIGIYSVLLARYALVPLGADPFAVWTWGTPLALTFVSFNSLWWLRQTWIAWRWQRDLHLDARRA